MYINLFFIINYYNTTKTVHTTYLSLSSSLTLSAVVCCFVCCCCFVCGGVGGVIINFKQWEVDERRALRNADSNKKYVSETAPASGVIRARLI